MAEREGLRIGELAALAGVTTRTVRHYHRIGVLPEPEREGNGYRVYRLRDVVRLLRVRRLVELGLSLDEAADALADDEGREPREILTGLQADLLAQERRLAARRRRIDEVLTRGGDLTKSEQQNSALARLEAVADADHPGLVREHLIGDLVEPTVGPWAAPQAWETYRRVLSDADLSEAMLDASRRFEGLAGLDPFDPVVEALAREVGGFGEAVAALMPEELRDQPADPAAADRLRRAATAGMDAAQARCLRLMFSYWQQGSP